MAADFNAGSIEGTLDLDTTPFAAGLDRAKGMAADFEKKKVTPEADLDTSGFTTKKDVAQTELDKFGASKATAKADVDIAPALAKFAILNKVLDAGGFGKGSVAVGLMTAKVFALTGGLLSLLAAAGPVSVALAGIGAAGIAAFGGLIVALGLFAAVAKSAFGEIEAANKAGTTLTGFAGQAQAALKNLTGAWKDLVSSVKPEVFQMFTHVFDGIAGILPKLTPLLRTTADGVNTLVTDLLAVTNLPIFDKFLHSLQQFVGGFLNGAGPVLASLLTGFMHAFIVLQPLIAELGHGIQVAADAANNFAEGGGLHQFVAFAMSAIPMVVHLVGSLVSGVSHLIGGLQPLAEPAIKFIERLVAVLGGLNIKPLAQGFGDVLDALRPVLPVLGDLVNTILGPLGHLLSGIASTAIVPFAHALRQEAHPALVALHTILHALVGPLSAFAGAIANLLNPTGVHLFTALLQALSVAVVQLAPSLGRLAVALESVIDDGLEVIIPLIPALVGPLQVAVGVISAVAGALATILSHRAVVDVLLGIGAAVWIGVKAFQAYQMAVEAIAAVQTVFEAMSAGWAGLTVAQDANTASVVANRIGMIAWKVQSMAVAAASKAWAAAQWLLNAALDANPIALVVLAIAALAAGLIYAYKHSETFRNIVNGAFNAVASVARNVFGWLSNAVGNVVDFIRNHWVLLLSILTGPIGAAAIFIITHFSQIKDFIGNVIGTIKSTVSNGLSDVFGFFQSLPGRILGLGGSFLSAGRSLMDHVFSGLESAAGAVGGFASSIAGAIWSDLKSTLNAILPHNISINKGPIHLSVPLFPYLATGGVTQGPMTANLGDNPGGQEAVVPLDKYDIPRKGEVAGIASRAHEDNSRIIALLGVIAGHLSGQDPDSMAAALADVLGQQSDQTSRRMLQMARAS